MDKPNKSEQKKNPEQYEKDLAIYEKRKAAKEAINETNRDKKGLADKSESLDAIVKNVEGITVGNDELTECLMNPNGGLPGKSMSDGGDYAKKVLDEASIDPYLEAAGWPGKRSELKKKIAELRVACGTPINMTKPACQELREHIKIVADAIALCNSSGRQTPDVGKLTTKLSEKATQIKYTDQSFPDKDSLNNPPSGLGAAAEEIKKCMAGKKKDGNKWVDDPNSPKEFEGCKKKYIMDRYNIASEEEYNVLINQSAGMRTMTGTDENGNIDPTKSVWKMYTSSMQEGHTILVQGVLDKDQEYWDKNPDKAAEAGLIKNEEGKWVNDPDKDGTPENGPTTESYIRTFMDQMHWEQYIMGEAPRKSQNIEGMEVTPEDYYGCLRDFAIQYGFESEHAEGSKEYRKDLVQWLGRNAKPHPTEDAIAIGPDKVHNYPNKEKGIKKGSPPGDGIPDTVIGKDEFRTAGIAKKSQGYNGDALTKCLEEKAKSK